MSDSWFLVPKRRPAASLRLICVPFAGGGASVYRSWPASLPDWLELWATQLPGRESRFAEPRSDRLEQLVPPLADSLSGRLDLPYALFGHSMGALIAFELTRELRRRGERAPSLLVVSGRRAPHLPVREEPIHALPHDDFVAKLREFRGTPEAVLQNEELLELVLPILRADFAVSETYRHREEPPLDVPIVSLGGAEDHDVPVDDVRAWGEATSAAHESHIFPGGHFYFLDEPTALLDVIRPHLEALRAPGR